MVYRRLFVISRAALFVIVGLLMTSAWGAARLIRHCHETIALERPIFAMHACQVAAAVGAGAAERIATAFVGNAMPNQWSHAPGTVPPAFTEIAGRARRIHDMLGSVPRTELFKRIEDEAIRLGRSNAGDHY